MTDPLRNPQDPLHNTPEEAKNLFRKLSEMCDGHSADAVIGAAMNLVINALRTAHPKRAGASAAFDEVSAKAQNALLDQHYDAMGNRRNIFPFEQVMKVEFFNTKNRFFQT